MYKVDFMRFSWVHQALERDGKARTPITGLYIYVYLFIYSMYLFI